MIFVSSPYSHIDKEVEKQRFIDIAKFTAEQVAKGNHCFSPIVYGHTLVGFCDMPTDWKFWKDFCETYLSKCSELWVVKMEGWDKSSGIAGEIEFAVKNNIAIKYITLNIED